MTAIPSLHGANPEVSESLRVSAGRRPRRQRVCELRRASLPRNSAVWPGGLPCDAGGAD